jgi:peroxiredoxin
MKQTVIIALLVSSLASAWALNIGDTAPQADLKMKNVDGKELSIAEVKGAKGTLVIFSCQHCPFAKAWDARIAALGNEYLKKGVGVIQINSNDPAVGGDTLEAMQQQAKKQSYEFPYVVDATSGVAKAFGAARTPEIFLFDSAGKLVYHGAADDNKDAANVKEHYLKDALEAVAAGKDVTTKETKAVGCGIKFRS